MSYEMKSSSSLDRSTNFSMPSSLHSSSSSAFRTPAKYSPVYSQCGDLLNSIQILSRSLRRMHVDHALTGISAVVMASGVTGPETKPEIDLVLSHQSYMHFLKSCVHQQVKPIEGEERTFWDSRTGCTVRICVAGERVKIGRRSIEIPALNTMEINEDGIKSWIVESKGTRKVSRKLNVSAVSVTPASEPIAA
jgi:hypothetical protein